MNRHTAADSGTTDFALDPGVPLCVEDFRRLLTTMRSAPADYGQNITEVWRAMKRGSPRRVRRAIARVEHVLAVQKALGIAGRRQATEAINFLEQKLDALCERRRIADLVGLDLDESLHFLGGLEAEIAEVEALLELARFRRKFYGEVAVEAASLVPPAERIERVATHRLGRRRAFRRGGRVGRAPRRSSNCRSRGSRRTAGSRAGPGDDPDPEPSPANRGTDDQQIAGAAR